MMWCSARQSRSTASATSLAPSRASRRVSYRRAAGVPGLAVDLHREPPRARDRGDDTRAARPPPRAPAPARCAPPGSPTKVDGGRAAVADRAPGPGRTRWNAVRSVMPSRVGQVPPGLVPAPGHRGLTRAGPCRTGRPPRPRTRRRRARTAGAAWSRRRADHLDRHQHAEDPVVPPGVGHGVQVRAEQERRRLRVPPRPGARTGCPPASCHGVQPDLAHPAGGHAVHARRARGRGRRARCRRASRCTRASSSQRAMIAPGSGAGRRASGR